MLRRDCNTENESLDATVRSHESSHVTTTAEEVVNTTQVTRANRPEIEPEDVENDHEGDMLMSRSSIITRHALHD